MTYTNSFLRLLVLCAVLAPTVTESRSCKKNSCCPTPSTATACAPSTFDYVIVGLGTAGAALARYLSDDFSNSVLVIEAGEQYNDDTAVLQSTTFSAIPVGLNVKYSKTYAVQSANIFAGFGGLLYTEGRMWGGGSGHNYLLAVRGAFETYNEWAVASGNPRWTYANLLPIMKGMELYTPFNSVADLTQRGIAGALHISQENYTTISADPLSIQFATTAAAPMSPDYNIQSTSVATSSQQDYVTPPSGAGYPASIRAFSATAFLPTPDSIVPGVFTPVPVLSNEGLGLNGRRLQVLSGATASHILFDTSGSTPTATGIEYIVDGNRENVRQVYANKKIILCAGSIQNVGILQRSGVGPTAVLTPLNIPVIVNNANVGANLQDHVGTTAIMSVPSASPFQIGQSYIDLSTSAGGLGANFSAGVRRNQVLWFPGAGVFESPSALLALGIVPNVATQTSFLTTILKPNSRGTAKIVDRDPLTEVLVDFNFYSDGNETVAGSDAQNIVAALRIIQQTATAFGGTMIFPTPAMYAAGNATLFAAAKSIPVINYHAASTCRMGTSIANGVVDGNLNVFGVNNLMCADCSVEPTIQTGNTAYAAYVIGLEAARILGATVPTA